MTLTTAEIRAFKPSEKPYRQFDGNGLYLEVRPNGSKLWRWKYRHMGKEGRLALGVYPEISLAEARRKCDEARTVLRNGDDPAIERKKAKRVAKLEAANSFDSLAAEVLAKMERDGKAESTISKQRWFLTHLSPAIGTRPVTEIEPAELLEPLKKLERKGHHETAIRTRAFASRVFSYAIASGRAKANPAQLLHRALTTPKVKHYAAILDPVRFAELLRAIDVYGGQPTTCIALKLAPHLFVRPGELRAAEWSEFDLDAKIWNVSGGRTKQRRLHSVPLSSQTLALLNELADLTGGRHFLFPSMQTLHKPMSENTINQAFRRMGFSAAELTNHGLRSTASTFLNETGLWNPDAVERALAHGESSAVRAAYNRGNYWQERIKMAHWWSDHLDNLKVGGEILHFKGPLTAEKLG